VACTLWNEKDAYHSLLNTGLFKRVQTPIYVDADNPEIRVGEEKVRPEWTGKYPVEELEGKKIISIWWPAFNSDTIRVVKRSSPVYFPAMYLCDLSAMKGKVLRREWLHEFPNEKINQTWPIYFGIDFASTEDKLKNRNRDYFALSVWAAIPGGGAILLDGIHEHLGSQEAVDRTRGLATLYPSLQIVGVEKWGKGEVFKDQLLFSTNLPIVPYPQAGTPVRSKGQRFQEGLAPLFTTGRAWISDVHSPFIEDFIQEWVSWDGSKTSTGYEDCLDAVYWGAMAAQGHLMAHTDQEDLKQEPQDDGMAMYKFGEMA
jgi:phage terminase large subunit-like protein